MIWGAHDDPGCILGAVGLPDYDWRSKIGSKLAKRKQLLEKLEAGSVQSTAAMEAVAGSSARMAESMEKRQKTDSLYKQADLFIRLGDTESARRIIDQMAAMNNENDKKPAAIPKSITVNQDEAEQTGEDQTGEDQTGEDHSQPSQQMKFRSMPGALDSDDESSSSDHPSQPSDDSRAVKKSKK